MIFYFFIEHYITRFTLLVLEFSLPSVNLFYHNTSTVKHILSIKTNLIFLDYRQRLVYGLIDCITKTS